MKETFKYIGRWVIRFILMSIIFSTFQSCAKAVTSPSQAVVDEINTNIVKVANYYNIEHYPVYTRNNIQKDSSNLYCIFITDSTSSWNPNTIGAFFPQYDTLTTTYNGSPFLNNIRTTLTNISTNQQVGVSDWALTKNAVFKYMYTQFNWASNTNYAYVAEHEYGADIVLKTFDNLVFDNSLENTAYNGNLFTYYYQGDFYSNKQIKLGDILPNDSYYFEIRLKDSKTGVIKGTSFVALNTTPYTFYNDSAIYINEDFEVYAIPRLLNYSTQYQLEIISYYGDGGNNLQEDIDWFIFLPENAVVSDDIITSLGSGDFTTQDNANSIIDNNNNFFDNLYNKMFTISGDQVNEIINTTMSNVQIPSGEIAEIEQVFNYLSGEHGDFIISWTDKTTHFTVNGANISQLTIPSKQINFSEMERQSPELQQTMHWARLITNISIFSILIHEAYICLLATLGVPIAIYGQKLEEKAQLASQQQKQEQAWQNRLEQQRYNEWLYSHRKR